jgi:hypothetical protein
VVWRQKGAYGVPVFAFYVYKKIVLPILSENYIFSMISLPSKKDVTKKPHFCFVLLRKVVLAFVCRLSDLLWQIDTHF